MHNGVAKLGDLVITSSRVVFIGYSSFVPKSAISGVGPGGAGLVGAARGGAVGGVIMYALAAHENASEDRAALQAAWALVGLGRRSKYGLTLNERIGALSTAFSLGDRSLVLECANDRSVFLLRSGPQTVATFALRSPSDELYSIIQSWPEPQPSYDFGSDPHGYFLPFPSPKALIDRALSRTNASVGTEAMVANPKYMFATGFYLAALPSTQRAQAAAALSQLPNSFRRALWEPIDIRCKETKKELSNKRTEIAGGFIFGGIALGLTVYYGPAWWLSNKYWVGLLLFLGIFIAGVVSIGKARLLKDELRSLTDLRSLAEK